MIVEYDKLPVMYRAKLDNLQLIIEEVSPHIWMRIGTYNLARNKVEACEILKRNIQNDFTQKLTSVDFQARQFIRGLS